VIRRAKLSAAVVQLSELEGTHRFDAEYYQPHYLLQERKIEGLAPVPLSGVASVSDGNHMTIEDQFTDSGVRYLRGQDLGDFFISDTNAVYIPEEVYDDLKRSHMKPGDVLLSIVGTIGSVGLVTDQYSQLTGSCKLAIIRPNSIDPYFLATYFASSVGQDQIARRARGTVQQGLILPDLRDLHVPTISGQLIERIRRLIVQSQKQRSASEGLYAQAQALLTAELGLDKLDLSDSLYSVRRASEVQMAGRIDAEHFRVKYQRVMVALHALKPKEITPLGDLLTTIVNGHTPLHHDLSTGDIPFLTAEHVFDFRVNYDSDKRILAEHHLEEMKTTQLYEGDTLITIKGRIGNAAVVENLPVQTNINQDLALLRFKSGLSPWYIVGFLNSLAGKALTEQISTGQINPFLGLGSLRKVSIPLFDEDRMNEIGQRLQRKVAQAYQARQDAQRLLAEAKDEVERLIEEK
jgi:hypothetical protein